MNHGYHLLPSWQTSFPADAARRTLSLKAGRGVVRVLAHPRAQLVERTYRHGGLRRLFFPEQFLPTRRPAEELAMHRAAFDGGVATAEPVGWRSAPGMVPGLNRYFYYSVLLPEAAPLPGFVTPRQALARPARQMADILHRLFRLDIFHHDLNLNNWLVSDASVYLIDFDGAEKVTWDASTYLHRALSRIARSGKKLGLVSRKRAFLRLASTAARRFGLDPRRVLADLPTRLTRVSSWDRLRWQLSGGHQNEARM